MGENTSPGSVLDTISWSENSCGKKPPPFWTSHKGSAAFSSKLPKLYSLLVHDMRLKMVQMGHVTSFLTLAHKFVVVLQFQNVSLSSHHNEQPAGKESGSPSSGCHEISVRNSFISPLLPPRMVAMPSAVSMRQSNASNSGVD